uniref:CCHC-type domain-containing protein n=1 Tax=Panagrolaimus davidi TaxID=227884 RepID=A0A914QDG5_9BILA
MSGGRTCYKCQQEGHMARECPNAESGGGCGFSRGGGRGGYSHGGGGGRRSCYNCGNADHISHDCDQPRNMDNVKCYNCKGFGHMSRNCTQDGGSNSFAGSSRSENGGFGHRGSDHHSGVNQSCHPNMNFNLQKLRCWNCKLKHSLTTECPFKYCVFCWYQLIPGTIHKCDREWVKNLCNCNSQGDYRKIFHQGIETGWSWKQLYRMFLQMRHDAGNSIAVQVPEGEELSEAETPPKKKKAKIDISSDEEDFLV